MADPPFGKREKAFSSSHSIEAPPRQRQSECSDTASDEDLSSSILLDTDEDMGSPGGMVQLMCRLAVRRLKPNGRLVFFLPTKAYVSRQGVCAWLEKKSSLIGVQGGGKKQLRIDRVIVDELNTHLWRWMCVLQLVDNTDTTPA